MNNISGVNFIIFKLINRKQYAKAGAESATPKIRHGGVKTPAAPPRIHPCAKVRS